MGIVPSHRGLRIVLIVSFIAFLIFSYAYIGTMVSMKYECEDGVYGSEQLLSSPCKGLLTRAYIYIGSAILTFVTFAISLAILIKESFRKATGIRSK
jgi:hypothetical protein